MNILNFVVLLSLSTLISSKPELTLYSSCGNGKTFSYEQASYGSTLQSNRKYQVAVPLNEQLCQINEATRQQIKNLQIYQQGLVLVVSEGGCSFVTKSKNAQQLGADMLIVQHSESNTVDMSPGKENTDTIKIPSLTVATGGTYIIDLDKKCQTGLLIMIDSRHQKIIGGQNQFKRPTKDSDLKRKYSERKLKQEIPKYMLLPMISFDITQVHNFALLKELYFHYIFNDLALSINLQHNILYNQQICDTDICNSGQDCISYSTSLKHFLKKNHICYKGDQNHNGIQIIQEQLRSFLILKELGSNLWWQYAILFSQNSCQHRKQVEECAQDTLAQLEVQKKIIDNISSRLKTNSSDIIRLLKQQGGQLVKINVNAQVSSYQSLLYTTLEHLCNTMSNPPQKICRQLKHEDITVKINDFNNIKLEFNEPTGRRNMTTTQIVVVDLSNSMLENIHSLLITFSRCESLLSQYQSQCQPYMYRAYEDDFYMVGKFGLWNKHELNIENMDLYSKKSYKYHFIHLPKNVIKKNTITLMLQFSPSFKGYLKIIPKQNLQDTIIQGHQTIAYLIKKQTQFKLKLPNANDPNLEFFGVTIQAKMMQGWKDTDFQVQIQNRRSVTKSSKIGTWRVCGDNQFVKNYKCCRKNNLDADGICTLKMTITRADSPQLVRITLKRQTKEQITSIFDYSEGQVSGTKYNVPVDHPFTKILKMRAFGDYNFRQSRQAMVIMYGQPSESSPDLLLKTCRQNSSCVVANLNQWDKLEHAGLTQSIWPTNLQNIPAHQQYGSPQQPRQWTLSVGLNDPQNAPLRYKKQNPELNLYAICKQQQRNSQVHNPPFYYMGSHELQLVVLQQSEVFRSSISYYFQDFVSYGLRIDRVETAYGESQASPVTGPYGGKLILIRYNVDKNIRVMPKIILKEFSQMFLQPFKNGKIPALDNIFQNYFYSNISENMLPFTTEIAIEDRLKRPTHKDAPYYSLGWSSPQQTIIKQISFMMVRKFPEVMKISLFAYKQNLPGGRVYKLEETDLKVIIEFSSEVKAFENKLKLCLIEGDKCYGRDDFKYWRSVETNEIMTGLLSTDDIRKGFKVVIEDYLIDGVENVSKDVLKEYQTMPIQVKLKLTILSEVSETVSSKVDKSD